MNFRIFNELPTLSGPQVAPSGANPSGKTQGPPVTDAQSIPAEEISELELSDSLNSDTVSLKQGVLNISEGADLADTVDGAIDRQVTVLITLKEIADQSATSTTDQAAREALQADFQQLRKEFDRIGTTTELDGVPVLDGTLAKVSSEQISIEAGSGPNGSNDVIELNQELDLEAVIASNLGFEQDNVLTEESARTALNNLTTAISQLTEVHGRVADLKLKLDKAIQSLNTSIEGLTALPEFPENDPNFADELTVLTRDKILVESATAKAGQANLVPQGVFHLINQV